MQHFGPRQALVAGRPPREQRVRPGLRLLEPASDEPQPAERAGNSYAYGEVAFGAQAPRERSSDVLLAVFRAGQPHSALGGHEQQRFNALADGPDECHVAATHLLQLAAFFELVDCELTNG